MADNISLIARVLRWLDKPLCFAALYAAVLVASLVFIFRDFIFSDYMIASHDIVGFGVFYRTLLKDYLLTHHAVRGWNNFICCGWLSPPPVRPALFLSLPDSYRKAIL